MTILTFHRHSSKQRDSHYWNDDDATVVLEHITHYARPRYGLGLDGGSLEHDRIFYLRLWTVGGECFDVYFRKRSLGESAPFKDFAIHFGDVTLLDAINKFETEPFPEPPQKKRWWS